MGQKLTTIDFKLLSAIQEDCRRTYDGLSEIVNLSPTSCLRRIRKLEKMGLITGYHAHVNEKELGIELTVIVRVDLAQDIMDLDSKLEDFCNRNREVQQCYIISASADFMFIAKFRMASEFKEFMFNLIDNLEGLDVREYTSEIVVRTIHDGRFVKTSEYLDISA